MVDETSTTEEFVTQFVRWKKRIAVGELRSIFFFCVFITCGTETCASTALATTKRSCRRRRSMLRARNTVLGVWVGRAAGAGTEG